MYKFIIFAPNDPEIIFKIIDAAAQSGAGKIGNYSHCAFVTAGEGTWIPLENSKPLIGQIGKFEKAQEVKIEMECQKSDMNNVLKAIKSVHPYDKIAIDATEITRFE